MLLGGARSGKSSAAQSLAERIGREQDRSVTAVVTAEPLDAEMADRILRHKADRPAGWSVVEAPLHLADAVASVPARNILVLDCLTVWLTNRIVRGDSAEMVERSARAVAIGLGARVAPTIVVSNEVGMGVVPNSPLGRSFRDVQGWCNRYFADQLDATYLVVAGRPLRLEAGWEAVRSNLSETE